MENRRRFLKRVLLAVAWLGWMPWGSRALAGPGRTIPPKGTDPSILVNRNPADIDPRNLVLTPLKDFGNMGLSDHEVDLEAWRLEVKGFVKEEQALGYDELLRLPTLERNVLLICPGFFVNHGRWRGFSIKELLRLAGALEGATHVTVAGPQGPQALTQRYPMEDVLEDKVFLAHHVNERPLPRKHGFPLRSVAEGYYGYDWIKYVSTLTVDKVPGA